MSRKVTFAAAALIAALALLGGFCFVKYYETARLPEIRLDDADSSQAELFREIRPRFEDILAEDALTENSLAEDVHSGSIDIEIRRTTVSDLLAPGKEVNGETVAWLTIPGTHIDYPVMQCGDNDFYLHNGADGNYNYELGCPFLDYRCQNDFGGFNSIVYAHNMTKDMMFSDIEKFADKSFLEEHSKGYLVLSNEVAQIQFFAYLDIPSSSALYHTVFMTRRDMGEYIDLLFAMAKYTQRFTADDLKKYDDLHLLLLSTCTFEYDEARGVLVGII